MSVCPSVLNQVEIVPSGVSKNYSFDHLFTLSTFHGLSRFVTPRTDAAQMVAGMAHVSEPHGTPIQPSATQ